MINIGTISKINIRSIELVNFSAIFIGLAVFLPWLTHQFSIAGKVFLPMHFFVIIAGILLGWRGGLIVGLLTPLVSFVISGMPLALVLPQIIIEITFYGIIAGLLSEKFKLNIFLTLLITLLFGRIGLLFGIWLFTTSQSGSLNGLLNLIKLGWPGMILQLLMIPIVIFFLQKYLKRFEDHI